MNELLTKYLAGKSAQFNKILVDGGKLTAKGVQVVNVWKKIAKCENNEALITLPDGRQFPVTAYSVPSGNLYEILNFSGEITFTKEAQAAHKWVVSLEEIEVDESKLVSPAMLNDIMEEWKNADSQLSITLKVINKERKLVSDFKFFYADKENFYVVGNPQAGGISENIVYFRKVSFKERTFNDYYTKFNHYTNEAERMSWITK